MEYVILVNRTSQPLCATWDGRQYTLKPGETPLPLKVAEAAKRQNPIMGTQGMDPWDVQYLCGIKELGDPIDPVEQSNSKELIDPKILHAGKQVMEIPGTAQIYKNVRTIQASDGPLPASVGFEANPEGSRGPELP